MHVQSLLCALAVLNRERSVVITLDDVVGREDIRGSRVHANADKATGSNTPLCLLNVSMGLSSAAMLEDLDGHDHIKQDGRVERANLSARKQTSTRRETCSELLQGCKGRCPGPLGPSPLPAAA